MLLDFNVRLNSELPMFSLCKVALVSIRFSSFEAEEEKEGSKTRQLDRIDIENKINLLFFICLFFKKIKTNQPTQKDTKKD